MDVAFTHKEKIVQKVLDHIEENIETNINIDDLSKLSGYSRRHIQSVFKQHVKIPLGMYIRRRRVTRASTYLRLTNMNIIDISLKFGYDSQQTFCREFKKATGLTPLKYRRSHYWDFAPLLAEFKFHPVNVGSLHLCTLSSGYVSGNITHYDISVVKGDTSAVAWWKTIINNLNNKKQNIWSLSEYEANKKHPMRIKVSSVFGTHKKGHQKCQNDYPYPSGLYAWFSFRCNKEQYPTYSKYIYLDIFPKHKLKRRAAPDIEVFIYNGYTTHDNTLDCEYYIPVEL
jgi:AraC-like DNA-binding protein/predicted transcriptional regulator YdeE